MARLFHLLALSASVLLACTPLGTPAWGQEVRARVSADSVTVGQRFFLTLTADHDFVADPAFPALSGDSTRFGDLEVLARRSAGRNDGGAGLRSDSVVYEVTTFALDTAYVPPLGVRFTAGEDTFSVASEPIELPVVSLVPPDAEEVRDVAPLVEFPAPIWPWVLLGAAALALAALLFYFWRRRGRDEAPAPAVPFVSPYEEALGRLRALDDVDPADPAATKPFFVELSDLLRRYLARRTGVNAMEHTTRELVSDLGGHPRYPARLVPPVRTLLELADFVKFADGRPEAARSRAARQEARELLDAVEHALRPPEPTPQPADEAPPRTVNAPVSSDD